MNDHHLDEKVPVSGYRNVTLTCKASTADVAVIAGKAKAAGQTVSSFLRTAAVEGTVVPRPSVPPVNARQWRELSRVAANLNQIAHHCNSGQAHAGSQRVLKAVEKTFGVLSEVRAALLGTEGEIEK